MPDLAALRALVLLDLGNNGLEGPVPESLINHPSLQILYMSFNNLTGVLPVGRSDSNLSIAEFSYNRLNLTTVHQCGLCKPAPFSHSLAVSVCVESQNQI